MKKEDWQGAGYVVLFGMAGDGSTRTVFLKDSGAVEKEIERIKGFAESAGAYFISAFAVGNYYEDTK